MVKGHPPYLHTRYLSTEEQTYCRKNPTYAAMLRTLRTMRKDLHRSRDWLGSGMLDLTAKRYDKHRAELMCLERNLTDWDDEMASLAETLLQRPKFGVTEEVEFVEGRWHWVLPVGRLALPRHTPPADDVLFEASGIGLPPGPSLGSIISRLLRRPDKVQKRLTRSASVEHS